jgi:hypothetical protein
MADRKMVDPIFLSFISLPARPGAETMIGAGQLFP